MRVEMERHVPDVAPANAIAWWTDFRSGHVDHAFLPGTERRILASGVDGVTMEDRARFLRVIPVFHERLTASVRDDEVHFEGENTFSRFAGTYGFEPDGKGGTRVRLNVNVHLKRGLRWTDGIASRMARRLIERDLDGHIEEMRHDLVR